MVNFKDLLSAHITAASKGFHLVFIVDARAATSHYSFLENKSCRSGFAAIPYNSTDEILSSWRFDKESLPVEVTGTASSNCSISFHQCRLSYY